MKNGRPYPLGATLTESGVNFSVFSQNATAVHLLLFNGQDSAKADRVITLDRSAIRTGDYWHIEVPDIAAGQVYAYRVDGPRTSGSGHRFDPEKVLLDPYGKAVCSRHYRREAAGRPGDNEGFAFRSVVADPATYDWEGDKSPARAFRDTVIYELHVGGFTRHASSGIAEVKRGTYAGLIEKIPYLRELGITAVELMPVFQFDEQDAPSGLENYWGYSPVSFFAPHVAYSSNRSPLGCLDEFRDLVKALHRAGLEIILDVVYNHTNEGGTEGPTVWLKGFDNRVYYALTPDGSRYRDYTGTGNTLNAHHTIVRRLILDSLRYWVREMHVDGFRFDLASVLSRDELGVPVTNAPVIWDIDSDPVLAGTKLIAEAWDAGGLYQVGSFPGNRWKEWNGRFRDDVRAFLKSDRGTIHNLHQRILGSPDVYLAGVRSPEQSVNFVTCHDGFTLNDWVSYNDKYNAANGEDNRDGNSNNLSWNCGHEGPTEDPQIEALRERQMRNAYTLLLLSVGTPLLFMGDEVRRTQAGNNNAYCQNNSLSWLDWSLCERNAGLRRFVSKLIAFRQRLSVPFRGEASSLREFLAQAHIDLHGTDLHKPDFSDDSHALAATAYGQGGQALHLIFNAFWEPLEFAVPPVPPKGNRWVRVINTALPVPNDIVESPTEVVSSSYRVQPRSIVLLTSAPTVRRPLPLRNENQ